MKKACLDMNIFVYLKNEDYKSYFLNKYKDTEYEFLYSPAVLEDTGTTVLFKSNLSQEKLYEMYDVLGMIIKDSAYEKITIEDFELFLKSIGIDEYKIKTI